MNQKWTPSDQTDIRRTWAKHWPKEAQDAVWQRIVKQIEAGDTLPAPTLIVVHRSPEKMQ